MQIETMEDKVFIEHLEKYLTNQTSEQEKQQLVNTLRNSNRINSILEKHLNDADPKMDDETSAVIFERILSSVNPDKTNQPRRTAISKQMLRWAAILVLPIISALSVYLIMNNDAYAPDSFVTVTADYGQKAQITLTDGSRVWLNSGSKLTYREPFSDKDRSVNLTGEAYFEVAKSEKHPFTVKTKDMKITALGTAFNVSAYDDDAYSSSVLLNGKVKVVAQGQECILTKNERAIFNKTRRTLLTDAVFASDFVEWKRGNIYFQDNSFEEIAKTLARSFNVDINFVSDELRTMRFTGTLGVSSIRNALDILSLTSPMNYKMDGTTIELYLRK